MSRHGYSGSVGNYRGDVFASSSNALEMGKWQVKICLFPAVCVYDEPRSSLSKQREFDTSVENHVVNYRNFMGHDEAVGCPQIVSKAIVSVFEQDSGPDGDFLALESARLE